MTTEFAERRARWVLDSLGARELSLGDDIPYAEAAWEQVERGERPVGDELAEAFWHLARLEERNGTRDRHGRFPGGASALDPLDPPLERLRDTARPRAASVGRGALRGRADARRRPALALDAARRSGTPPGGCGRRPGRAPDATRCARRVAWRPCPSTACAEPTRTGASTGSPSSRPSRGARSTYFVLAGHGHKEDGFAPEVYDRLRPRLVETLLDTGAEVGLHGSYTSAEDPLRLEREAKALQELAGELAGQRYHFLRVDPFTNLAPLAGLGFRYDSSLGFADAPGFRAGIAHPFRPWSEELAAPLPLVEVPLALMDTTLAEPQYLGLSAEQAEVRALSLLDRAAEGGGGFSILWHTNRFDRATAAGWDRLYERILDGVVERGGALITGAELAAEADAWLAG